MQSLALQQFQVSLIAELLTPMQHARAEVASWPLLLDAFSTGDCSGTLPLASTPV